MMKYTAAPEAESIGATLIMCFENAPHIIEPVLKQYGYKSIDDIQADRWYPMQIWLDIFKRLEETDAENLDFIGAKLVENLNDSIDVESLPEAIALLNALFAVRNFPKNAKYDVLQQGSHHIQVIDNSPYPHDLVYGLIYGILREYRPDGCYPVLIRNFQNPQNPNADGAIYDLTW